MLTPNQERYLLAETASVDSFYISIWFECRNAPDIEKLKSALRDTISAEPGCRTGFEPDVECGFRSVVHPDIALPFHLLQVETIEQDTIVRATAPILSKIRDFADPAVLQAYFLVIAADGGHALVFSQHHAISDGRSLDMFVARVAARYNGTPVDVPATTISQFTRDGEQAAAAYFRDHLGGGTWAPPSTAIVMWITEWRPGQAG
jgi:NRPS condensation-like uncharacterized protein